MSSIAARNPLGLKLNISWTLAGNIVYGATQWATLGVLAKLGTTVEVGQFVLALAIAAPVILLANLNLRAIQATDAHERYGFRDYLSLRISCLGMALAALVLFSGFHDYARGTLWVVLLVALAKAVEAISDILYGRMQFEERMDAVAKSMIWKGSLSLAGWVVGLVVGGTLIWACVGLVVGRVATLVLVDMPSVRRLSPDIRLWPRWCLPTLRSLAWLALPLGLVSSIASLTTTAPRYAIERLLGLHELGVFGALAYLLVAGQLVMAAVAQSASPRLARLLAEGGPAGARKLLVQLTVLAAGLGLLSILVAWALGAPLLRLLYTAEYAEHVGLLVTLMVAGTFAYMGTVFGVANTAIRCLRPQLLLEFIVLLVVAGLCLLLIPPYGMLGAAVALIGASLVRLIGLAAMYLWAAGRHGQGVTA